MTHRASTSRGGMARFAVLLVAATMAGCASIPTPVMPADADDPQTFATPEPAPMIESPPLEPIEPPLGSPPPAGPAPSPAPTGTSPQASESLPVIIIAPPAPAEPSTEDQQMLALLSDLQRFGAMQNDELKRELAAAAQTFSRQRTDVNRVRLAVLYTLVRASPQDDQRALQLFENVAKSAGPTSPIRHLAAVLQAQVVERQRAVHDEQQKADAAIQKLEALRAMERSLLRDRVRSGGGGGGAGPGGSGR
jgi:hypothetical protein